MPSSLTVSATPPSSRWIPTATEAAPACWRDIGESLLQRPVDGQLGILREAWQRAAGADPGLDAGALAEVGDQRAKGRHESQVVQQRGAEVVGDAADAPDPGVDQLQRPIEARRQRRVGLLAQEAELQLDRREELGCLVMQGQREPPPLRLVLPDHLAGEPFQLGGPSPAAGC